MPRKACYFIPFVMVFTSSCVTTSDWQSGAPFDELAWCIDDHMHELTKNRKRFPGTITASLKSSFSVCDTEVNNYVDKLVEDTRSKHGWSSVQPSVKPAVKSKVVDDMLRKLEIFYGGSLS